MKWLAVYIYRAVKHVVDIHKYPARLNCICKQNLSHGFLLIDSGLKTLIITFKHDQTTFSGFRCVFRDFFVVIWMISSLVTDANRDVIFPELFETKEQRILGV